jgi:3'-phosphoadenosine 5'-phosphosulfate sulfotransferase (PAPS reductase)/FAD synthetase
MNEVQNNLFGNEEAQAADKRSESSASTCYPSGLSVVSYGGGVNSTALLLGMAERNEMPDLILFADTGGEFAETVDYVARFSDVLKRLGMPEIVTVKYDSKHGTLEQECLNNETLPSLAFGFRGCSVKWKRQPMDKYIRKEWPAAIEVFESGQTVERLIGIDAGESHRGKIPDDKLFTYRFPLIEWDWARDECEDAIRRHGLPIPRKSACFFCPAMKKHEIFELSETAPDLFGRAVNIERNAAHNLVLGKALISGAESVSLG